MNNDKLLFSEDNEQHSEQQSYSTSWNILIVDDEQSIHDITVLALDDFEFQGMNLNFYHAHSAKQAIEILKTTNDIALALIDVVMETEHAGLELVEYIRNHLNNSNIRIVLRTGQPGQAPERSVINKYDINDYKEKTELTSQKLYSVVYTSLRSYRDLMALDANRQGLEKVIIASTEINKAKKLPELINGILEQLVAVLYLNKDSVYVNFDGLAIEGNSNGLHILAGSGKYANLIGDNPAQVLDKDILALINRANKEKTLVSDGNNYALYFSPSNNKTVVLFFSSSHLISKDCLYLLGIFCNNLSVSYNNLLLHQEVEDTQKEIMYMLGEAVETRSKETGNHVRRVAKYSYLLGELIGLPQKELDAILIASPLHDVGKIGIPDEILHKPGGLNDDEWNIMQTHAEQGKLMLGNSEQFVIKTASIIAGEHHEKWNGKGYPNGLKGNEIHIHARITALADVYDALGSRRSYKEPWPLDQIIELVKSEKGKHFDPQLVDLLCDNIRLFNEIAEKYPD